MIIKPIQFFSFLMLLLVNLGNSAVLQDPTVENPVNVAPRAIVIASSVYQNEYAQFGTQKLIDGLTGADYDNEWLAQGTLEGTSLRGTLPAYLQFNLQASYMLSGISLFNTMNSPFDDTGTKDFSIQVSADGINYSSSILDGQLVWQNSSYQTFQFSNFVTAQYVQINLNSAYVNPTWGLYDRVGLKEVQITAVPEPASASLLLSGLALALIKRRRK